MATHYLACQTGKSLRFLVLILTIFTLSSGLVQADPPKKQTSLPASSAGGPKFNLTDFGAAGDGITDDGPAFQQALNAVAQAGGGTLFVPSGKYFIATPVIKDFAGLAGPVIIQGVPSATMPAPPSASGQELAAGLDLVTDIIPATGNAASAFTLTNLKSFLIEHISFSGRPTESTDAFITLNLSDIDDAIIRHCEFYGLSSMGGGNIVRGVRSRLSIELSVFLGCTANSGGYAPTVENIEWRGFSISNSIFLDYGLRPFFGKTGLGSPFSWINMAWAAAPTSEFPRREFVVHDLFLDEGGWIGITATPHRWGMPGPPIDLVYITGLKMNVSNFGTHGHAFFDVRDVMIENSYYGWSHNASSAVALFRVNNAIYDNLTCVANATHLYADDLTQRFTLVNSQYEHLDSLAQTTTVLETPPEQDPVQFVRSQFLDLLGRAPDAAAHFYWSDLLIRCGKDNRCVEQVRSSLNQYLSSNPQPTFTLSGTIFDEEGEPLSGVAVEFTGANNISVLSDAQGKFRFSRLPTSGSYSVSVTKSHYSFAPSTQTVLNTAGDQNVVFIGSFNRHSISGRIETEQGNALPGVTVTLNDSTTTTTDQNGNYSFPGLIESGDYSVTTGLTHFVFSPANKSFVNLSADQTADFVAKPLPQILTVEGTNLTLALDSVTFMAQPFSILSQLGFGSDGVTRVMIFVTDLKVTDISQVSATVEDEEGTIYPIIIENLATVPGEGWVKQLNLKLNQSIPSGSDLKLRVSIAEGSSDPTQLNIKAQEP